MPTEDIRLGGVKIGEWERSCASLTANRVTLGGVVTYSGTLELSTGAVAKALDWLGELLSETVLKRILDEIRAYVPDASARVDFSVEANPRTWPCAVPPERPRMHTYEVVLVITVHYDAGTGPVKKGTAVSRIVLVRGRVLCSCETGEQVALVTPQRLEAGAVVVSGHPAGPGMPQPVPLAAAAGPPLADTPTLLAAPQPAGLRGAAWGWQGDAGPT